MPKPALRVHFPGGRAPLAAFRAAVETAMSHGDGELMLGSQQDLVFSIDIGVIPPATLLRHTAIWRLDDTHAPILSTLPATEPGSGTPWLQEGAYATAIASFDVQPTVPVMLGDPKQSASPVCCARLNFLAATAAEHWRPVICQLQPPYRVAPRMLLHSAYLAKATAALTPLLNAVPAPGPAAYTQALRSAVPTALDATEELELPGKHGLPMPLQGFHHYPAQKTWTLALPCGAARVDAQFLLDVCLRCRDEAIQFIGMTPMRTLVIRGIKEAKLQSWRQLLVRHKVPLQRSETELLALADPQFNAYHATMTSALAHHCPSTGGVSFGIAGAAMPAPDTPLVIKSSPDTLTTRFDIFLWEEPQTASGRLELVIAGLRPSAVPEALSYWIRELAGAEAQTQKPNRKEAEPTSDPRCSACLTAYSAVLGDPTQDVLPDTPFKALPESWVCPVCEGPKDAYHLNTAQRSGTAKESAACST